MNNSIQYKKGYKYQLVEEYSIITNIKVNKEVKDSFINLQTDGLLIISSGYAWDGPSGPVLDTKHNLRGALVHDAFYQLLRKGVWNLDECESVRKSADVIFRKICIEDGVFKLIAYIYYWGVRIGAKFASDPKNKRRILVAP